MDRTLPSAVSDPFISLESALAEPSRDALAALIDLQLLPLFHDNGEVLVLSSDLQYCRELADAQVGPPQSSADRLFSLGPPEELAFPDGTRLELLGGGESSTAFGPAVYRLFDEARKGDVRPSGVITKPYLGFATLVSTHDRVVRLAESQVRRVRRLDHLRASELAASASYMGSKRELAGFLVEALSTSIGTEGTVVDLMCGSGAASAAFSQYWPTIASDAQEFCRLLAMSQGGGTTVAQARDAVDQVLKAARLNADELLDQVEPFVKREAEILHIGDWEPAAAAHRHLMEAFPTWSMPKPGHAWDPRRAVEERRMDPNSGPACLFTAYFATVFFGIRQAVEIDSLRYAIESLESPVREWALASLIASVVSVATTYGGHFAQPRIGRPEQITSRNVARITETRALSVVHEFAARLVSLAAESEQAPHIIDTVPGPWETALSYAQEKVGDSSQVIVYVDPPYRREEYSRYYHVLETLVRYDYPSVAGGGLMPSKGSERFASRFFTRSKPARERELAAVIESVAARGWSCAWSYADNADGSIPAVLSAASAAQNVAIRSFAARHRHRAHGGSRYKTVTEHLILIEPRF